MPVTVTAEPSPTTANGRSLGLVAVLTAGVFWSFGGVLGKATGLPVAVIRGVDPAWFRRSSVADELVRPPAEDLFR